MKRHQPPPGYVWGPLHQRAMDVLLVMGCGKRPWRWWPFHVSYLLDVGLMEPDLGAGNPIVVFWPWRLTPAGQAVADRYLGRP